MKAEYHGIESALELLAVEEAVSIRIQAAEHQFDGIRNL